MEMKLGVANSMHSAHKTQEDEFGIMAMSLIEQMVNLLGPSFADEMLAAIERYEIGLQSVRG